MSLSKLKYTKEHFIKSSGEAAGEPSDSKSTKKTNNKSCTEIGDDDNVSSLSGLLNDLSISVDGKDYPIVLYYGFFFDEQTCTSLKSIGDKYLKECFETVPEFEKFLCDSYAKVNGSTDPLSSFYKYPCKKKKAQTLPDFHVTTKFCDRDKETCSKYWKQVKDLVGKTFLIHIIGLFFTDKTCGFRVKLTPDQQLIFDERSTKTNSNSIDDHAVATQEQEKNPPKKQSKSNKKGKNVNSDKKSIPSGYDGVTLSAVQEINFTPCKSRAHITIGCAKFVNAVQTGEDLEDIVDLEMRSSSIFHKDYSLECGGTLRQFGVFKDAFVVYLRRQLIAQAEFKFKE